MDEHFDETVTQTLPPPTHGRSGPSAPGDQGLSRREGPGGKPWSSSGHAVNLRLSLPGFGGRYYLTLVAGREKRSAQRLAFERKKHPLKTTGNILFTLALGMLLGAGAIALILLTAVAILERNGALAAL